MQSIGATEQRDGKDAGFDALTESRRPKTVLEAGVLQDAVFNSVNFSCIATDALGVIQIFNVGAECMLGYLAADVLNRVTPADISDQQELISRAKALSLEPGTPIRPGFEALVFKASRGIEDIYELTYIRKDGSRLPAVVSVTALRDNQNCIIGYLLIATDNTVRKRAEQVVQAREEQLSFLNGLADATRLLDDPMQVMTVMSRKLGLHLRASRCAYAEVMGDGEQFTILHDYTDGCASTVGSYGLSLFGAKAVSKLNAGQTLIISNVDTELSPGDGADMFNAIGIKAIITCPLVKHNGLRAMMAVHQTTPRDWTTDEIALFRKSPSVAGQPLSAAPPRRNSTRARPCSRSQAVSPNWVAGQWIWLTPV